MTTEQATRAAIVAAVRAFVQRVDGSAEQYGVVGMGYGEAYAAALRVELAALERAAAAEGAPEGGSQETNAHE
jgi:hypothetical protein